MKPDEERADALAVLVHSVAGDDHVRGTRVLDLELHALVRLVRALPGLGDQPVEPGAFECDVPVVGLLAVECRRNEMDRRFEPGPNRLEHGASIAERFVGQIGLVDREHVEGDELGWGLRRQAVDARLRGVDPLLEGVETEVVADRHDDLAVDHTLVGEAVAQRVEQLREVARERSLVSRSEVDLVAIAKDDAAEAVPLGFEREVAGVGDAVDGLGQHRLDGRNDRQVHDRRL